MAEILDELSHDSVNRFLLRERYEPKDLFEDIKGNINLTGGTLSEDYTVIEKLYIDPNLTAFLGYFWSGNLHRPAQGINLITLYYTDRNGKSVPVNYRLYNKKEGKTKNDYLREMITEVIAWGLKPKIVTADTWYSSQENLKFLRNQKLGFLMGIAKKRQVSLRPGEYTQVENLEIPEDGLVVHLKQLKPEILRQFFTETALDCSNLYSIYAPNYKHRTWRQCHYR